MVKGYSDSERGNPLPPHGLLFPISSKGSFICTIPDRIAHTTAFITPVVIQIDRVKIIRIKLITKILEYSGLMIFRLSPPNNYKISVINRMASIFSNLLTYSKKTFQKVCYILNNLTMKFAHLKATHARINTQNSENVDFS